MVQATGSALAPEKNPRSLRIRPLVYNAFPQEFRVQMESALTADR
jgi:hypothetical protein